MDTRDVTRKINEQFNDLFTIRTEDNGRKVTKPNICGVCDEYIHRNDKQFISMKLLKETHYLISKQEGIEYHEGCDDYYFDGDIYDDSIPWCNLLLSPDTQVIQRNDTNDGCGILSCGTCKESMKKHRMPINAIANVFFFRESARVFNMSYRDRTSVSIASENLRILLFIHRRISKRTER